MARLGSWALLRFVVLALLGPQGAGAQGKGMRGGPGAGGSSFTPPPSFPFDAGGGAGMGGEGDPAWPPLQLSSGEPPGCTGKFGCLGGVAGTEAAPELGVRRGHSPGCV